MDEFRVHFWPRNEFASISGRRNRRLCRGVALPPGTPPEHGAARRNPAARGSNMLVVSSTLSFRSGASGLSTASQSTRALLCGRRQTQSPVLGRPHLSLLRHSIANDGRLRHRALLGDIKVVVAFELHASSRASCFTLVVDIVPRMHAVPCFCCTCVLVL